MADINYLDFDLRIERTETGYRARVVGSQALSVASDFTLPFSDEALENYLLKIGRPRRDVRRFESREVELAKDFGRQLFDAAFGKEILSCLRQSLDEATRQDKGLRLRLNLTDAPELADLPWEYLYEPQRNLFFALFGKTPIVRYLDIAERIQPLAVQPPLKILVMISAPSGVSSLDTGREWTNLTQALADLQSRGLVTLDRLDTATLPELQRRLRQGQYHIFHFIGHGAFVKQSEGGALLLEDDQGGARAVGGQELGWLLRNRPQMRLAILNACEGGRASRSDPFAGAAQSLVQQGLPAVIAMQFEISDQAAITFTREFYAALADGYPVDAALTEARLAIFAANDNGLEWGTPVLYMRAPDGRIFDLAATAPRPAPPAEEPKTKTQDKDIEEGLAQRYTQALACFYTEQWDQAAEAFREIVARRENYEDAAAKLTEATRQAELAARYAEGQKAVSTQAWTTAIKEFQAILALDAGYRDVAALLADAKRRKVLADLYAEARRLHAAGTWPAVIKVFERIAAVDPATPDPENLLASARAAVEADERERRLAGLYSQGIRSLDEGKLAEALTQFQEVQSLSPGYAQVEALLVRVKRLQVERQAAEQRRAQLADLYHRGTQRMQAGQLEETQQYLEEIERLQPGYQDVEALLAQARHTLAERKSAEQQQARLNDLYDQASSQLRLENWGEAERLCTQLLTLQPHYRDTETLLAKARNRLAAQRAAREAAALPPPPTAQSGKPATLPEAIRVRPKPKDLPH